MEIRKSRGTFFLWLFASWLVFRTENVVGLAERIAYDGSIVLAHVNHSFLVILLASMAALLIDHGEIPERIINYLLVGRRQICPRINVCGFSTSGLVHLRVGGYTNFLFLRF
jgi:hypothetical protein